MPIYLSSQDLIRFLDPQHIRSPRRQCAKTVVIQVQACLFSPPRHIAARHLRQANDARLIIYIVVEEAFAKLRLPHSDDTVATSGAGEGGACIPIRLELVYLVIPGMDATTIAGISREVFDPIVGGQVVRRLAPGPHVASEPPEPGGLIPAVLYDAYEERHLLEPI